jgi:hypothetical protein
MVLRHRESPFTEPFPEWLKYSLAFQRVTTQDFPLRFRRLAHLVQDIDVDGELSNVVQESGPPKPVTVTGR